MAEGRSEGEPTDPESIETADLIDREPTERWRAAAAVTPFLLLGLGSVVLLLGWGLNGLWAFMILPPILFMCVLGWLAFRHGFVRDAGDGRGDDASEPSTSPPDRRR